MAEIILPTNAPEQAVLSKPHRLQQAILAMFSLDDLRERVLMEFVLIRAGTSRGVHTGEKLLKVGYYQALRDATLEVYQAVVLQAAIAVVQQDHPVRGKLLSTNPKSYPWYPFNG